MPKATALTIAAWAEDLYVPIRTILIMSVK